MFKLDPGHIIFIKERNHNYSSNDITNIIKTNGKIVADFIKEQVRLKAEPIKEERLIIKKEIQKVDKKTLKPVSKKKVICIQRKNTPVCTLCYRPNISKRLFDLHKYLHRLEWNESQPKLDISKNIFICNFCEAEFPTLDKMNSHIESHKENCKECSQTFANAFILGIHMAEHDGEENICCSICSYRGTVPDYLKAHLLNRHFKPKICESCGATYSSKVGLEEHIRFHHENMDAYVCIVCERKFIFKSGLRTHQINSHRPFIDGDLPSNYCILCKRTLKTVKALKRHIQEKHSKESTEREHSKEIPKNTEKFVCDICGKKFTRRKYWLAHTKIHSELKPYKCKLCPKAFKAQVLLTSHEKMHSDEKPFSCEVCGAGFKRRGGLRKHFLTHSDIKPFKCSICSEGFRLRKHLRLHSKCCIKKQ